MSATNTLVHARRHSSSPVQNAAFRTRLRAALRSTLRATLLPAAIIALSFVAPRSALAASSSCTAWSGSLTNSSCTTGAIWANPTNHFVHISVAFASRYTVRDARNGVVVATGSTGWLANSRTITGLYSLYTLRMYDSPWGSWASISNN